MRKSILVSAIGIALASSASAELKPTFGADDLSNVHNRCIVRLQNDMKKSDVSGLARNLAVAANSTIRHVYKNSIKGFTLNTNCEAAKMAFGKTEGIYSFTPDSVMSISKGRPGGGGNDGGGGQQASYGTARVGGPVSGSGRTAWIIDSGVDLDHPDLNVDTSRGFSAIKNNMEDQNGHGTHVAGTIGALDNSIGALGVAPGTTIVPVRVLDRRGSGSTSGVIAGVDHVGANASAGDCVNMSLGGGVSTVLDDAVKSAAQSSGAYFVLAAGNESDNADNHSPARANGNNIYTIAAMSEGDNWASYSNYGNGVDYIAPGSSIFSLWKNGGTNTISGTSMASPHACAVIMMKNGNPSTDGSVSGPDGNYPIVHL